MTVNARFWLWWRGGWVKLTLRRGDKVTAFFSESTDEGWHSEAETYRFDGAFVTCRTETDGRDCDGRLSTHRTDRCHVMRLRARMNEPEHRPPDDGGLPEWRTVKAGQRDYSAEAAGF